MDHIAIHCSSWIGEDSNVSYKNDLFYFPGPYVYLVDTPDLDRERTPNYTLNVIASDGVLSSPMLELTVFVLDVNEKPRLNKLPAIIAIYENVAVNASVKVYADVSVPFINEQKQCTVHIWFSLIVKKACDG